MPMYRYKCTNCDHEFEKLMKLRGKSSDKIPVDCPECGCSENTPMINKTTFSLKGGGWYKDGYS